MKIKIVGPYRECATEYGYGDYYLAIEELGPGLPVMEYDHLCVQKGIVPSKKQISSLRARARRTAKSY